MATIGIKTEGSLLVVSATGIVTANEVIAVVNEYYPREGLKDVIWDLSKASLQSISRDGFGKIAQAVKETVANGARQGGKTAFVGNSAAEYGLLRMYSIIAEIAKVPINYNVFNTIEEAMNWLAQD